MMLLGETARASGLSRVEADSGKHQLVVSSLLVRSGPFQHGLIQGALVRFDPLGSWVANSFKAFNNSSLSTVVGSTSLICRCIPGPCGPIENFFRPKLWARIRVFLLWCR